MNIPDYQLNGQQKILSLFYLFIKKDVFLTWKPIDFSRERGAAKRLIKKYEDYSFFYDLTDMHNKWNSLLGLTTKKYVDLESRYDFYISEKLKNKKYELSDKPIEILGEPHKKSKSIIDLLDN